MKFQKMILLKSKNVFYPNLWHRAADLLLWRLDIKLLFFANYNLFNSDAVALRLMMTTVYLF